MAAEMKNKKYYTVGTVKNSIKKSIPLTHKYLTSHSPRLVQTMYLIINKVQYFFLFVGFLFNVIWEVCQLYPWLIDWLVFNANFNSISAISWREHILYIRHPVSRRLKVALNATIPYYPTFISHFVDKSIKIGL